jgi:hypothetical protein
MAPPQGYSEYNFQGDVMACARMNGWSITLRDIESKNNTPRFPILTDRLREYFQSPSMYGKLREFLFKHRSNAFALCYHTYNSRGSHKGFPDLVLIHPGLGVVIFAELKAEGQYPTLEQRLWLAALETVALAAPETVYVRLWRPRDWPEVVEMLGGIDPKQYA